MFLFTFKREHATIPNERKTTKKKEAKKKIKKESFVVSFRLYKLTKTTNEKKRKETKQRNFLKNQSFKRNETMISFEDFWQLLYDHGSRNYYKNETLARWNELSAEQQQTLYERISEKIRNGKFVDYNPLEAIHDNLQRTNRPLLQPPTNYAGKPLPRGFEFYLAEYNGQRGLYKAEDVKAHNMLNPQKFDI